MAAKEDNMPKDQEGDNGGGIFYEEEELDIDDSSLVVVDESTDLYDIDASADQPRTNLLAELVAAERTTTAASGLVIIDEDGNSGLPVPIGMIEASLNNAAEPIYKTDGES